MVLSRNMRAMDRMFDRIMDVTGAGTPFRAVENVFDSSYLLLIILLIVIIPVLLIRKKFKLKNTTA